LNGLLLELVDGDFKFTNSGLALKAGKGDLKRDKVRVRKPIHPSKRKFRAKELNTKQKGYNKDSEIEKRGCNGRQLKIDDDGERNPPEKAMKAERR
jgi:hypothetical protein